MLYALCLPRKSRRLLVLLLLALILVWGRAHAAQEADDRAGPDVVADVGDDEQPPAIQPAPRLPARNRVTLPAHWLLGDARPQSLATAQDRLKLMLNQRLDTIDRVCDLRATQRERIRLGGFGSIAGFFERVAGIQRQFEAGRGDPAVWHLPVVQDAAPLREAFRAGPFEEGSRFERILKKTMTAEQAGRYEVLRDVERAAGLLTIRERGTETLVQVRLGSSSTADAGLVHLHRFANLQLLELDASSVTDAGLEHLRECISLETLDLNGTRITGAGLRHLARLTNLQVLDLHGTPVGDDSLPHLQRLFGLVSLNLQGTQITDAGLMHLAPLGCLQRLDLGRTPLSDAGLAKLNLAAMPALQELGLGGTQVSDAGLAHIKELPNLKQLDLSGTPVSKAAIADLQHSLPGLIIIR